MKIRPAFEAVNFRIERTTKNSLLEIAKSKNLTLSQLVRDIFNDYLQAIKKN